MEDTVEVGELERDELLEIGMGEIPSVESSIDS